MDYLKILGNREEKAVLLPKWVTHLPNRTFYLVFPFCGYKNLYFYLRKLETCAKKHNWLFSLNPN